jgi:hypothetical protein
MTALVNHSDKGLGSRGKTQSRVTLGCGVLAVFTAVWIYWLVLPGVALALGIVAVLLVPSVIVMTNDAESWGRDCALHPAQSDC